jgi:hypothetical protein
MEKRVSIETWQKVTRDDFLKFGTFPQASFDTVVGKVLIPDRAFEGFQTVQSGPAEVTVGNGHLLALGKIFFNDSQGGTPVDMLALLPAATRRIIAITVWGQELDSKLEPRTFLTDADTRATVARDISTEHWRWANIGPVAGIEGPDPARPAIASDVLAVAWVTLSTVGVEAIVSAFENQVPTLRECSNRLNENDIWRRTTGTRIDTLASDLSALSARVRGFAPWDFVKRLTADVSRLKDLMKLPEVYVAYGADHFLTDDESDTANVAWLAKIEEGVRFPPAAGFDAQLGLLNQFDEKVIINSNVMLPAWDAVSRIENVGTDTEISIAQYQHQTVDFVQKTMGRMVTRYGTPFTVCTNSAWWQDGTYDPYSGIFRRNTGEVFQILGAQDNVALWQGRNLANHTLVRLEQVWQDYYTDTYWDRIVVTGTVSGSVLSQTFLNSQDGWLSGIDLFFSRVALSGDVQVMICETINGAPAFDKVIGRATKLVADLHVSPRVPAAVPTTIGFQPVFLQKGMRYAIVVVSSGNHYVWCLKDTNFVSGTLFYSTDGAWAQGDLVTDLAFRANFCKFRSNRVEVQLNALQLQNGIAAVDINADAIIPGGVQGGSTGLHFEIQVNGLWHALDNVDGGPSVQFVGLPPLLPFRVVFTGTTDVQPALGVASNSRVTTWRPRGDLVHISEARTMTSVAHVEVQVRLESWSGPPHHTLTCRLGTGAGYLTMNTNNSMVETPAPDDPTNAIIRTYTFNIPGLTTYKIRFDGTTDNVLDTFHIAERIDIGYN